MRRITVVQKLPTGTVPENNDGAYVAELGSPFDMFDKYWTTVSHHLETYTDGSALLSVLMEAPDGHGPALSEITNT